MKEDILEQIVEDYLLKRGYFTKHNIKYRPDPNSEDYNALQDSGYSDIDVLAIHPGLNGANRIMSVSCKSYQNGFNISTWVKNINSLTSCTKENIRTWGRLRELANPKWTMAFCEKIKDITGSSKFTYVLSLTKITGFGRMPLSDRTIYAQDILNNCERIKSNFENAGASIKFKVLTFKEIFDSIFQELNDNKASTLESSDIGRLIQLIQAAGLEFSKEK